MVRRLLFNKKCLTESVVLDYTSSVAQLNDLRAVRKNLK